MYDHRITKSRRTMQTTAEAGLATSIDIPTPLRILSCLRPNASQAVNLPVGLYFSLQVRHKNQTGRPKVRMLTTVCTPGIFIYPRQSHTAFKKEHFQAANCERKLRREERVYKEDYPFLAITQILLQKQFPYTQLEILIILTFYHVSIWALLSFDNTIECQKTSPILDIRS